MIKIDFPFRRSPMKFLLVPEHEIVEAARIARTESRKAASEYIKQKYPSTKTASGFTVAKLVDNGLKIFLTYGHNAYFGKPEGRLGESNDQG
jgi:hypothetical protein